MFWIDWGEIFKIEKCGMNGDINIRQVLIGINIFWFNVLVVDYIIDRIWWVDVKFYIIEFFDFFGKNRRIILSENINYLFVLIIFQSYIYWIDWYYNVINRVNKFIGEERFVVIENLFLLMDIYVYYRQR